MTETTENRTMRYSGDGSTVLFPYSFTIAAGSDLEVVAISAAGVETVQTLGVDYTVTGAGVVGGGNVVMTVAPASGTFLVIVPDEPATQATQLRNQGPYFASDVEDALDKRARIDEQQQQEIDRSLKIPLADATSADLVLLPFDRASKVLGFDAGKLPIAMDMPSGVTVPAASVVQVVDTIAALKGVSTPATAVVYFVRGYYAAGDGGGGLFRWNGTDATADNGGSVIAPTVGSGRWNRLWSGMLESRWFGAKHDGATDDSAAFQAMVDTGYDCRGSTSGGTVKLTSGLQITTRYQHVDLLGCKITSLGAPISIQAQNVVLDGPHYEGNYAAPHGIVVVGSATDATKTSHQWLIRSPRITASAALYAIVVANGSYIGDIEHPQISNGGGSVTANSRGLFLGDEVQTVNVWGGAITGWESAIEMRGNDGVGLYQVDLGDGAASGYYVYGNAIPAGGDPSPFGTGVYPNGEGSWWGSPTQVIGNLTINGCYCELSDIGFYFKTGLEVKSLTMRGNLIGLNNSSPNFKSGTRVLKSDIPMSNVVSEGNWAGIPEYAFELNDGAVNAFFSRDNWSDVGREAVPTHQGVVATGTGAERVHYVRCDGNGYQKEGYARGRVIGDTGDKLGFFGLATPIVQPVGATQAAFVDSTGGSASGTNTLAAITAPAANATTSLTNDMTAVKNALATIAAAVNAHRLVLVNLGLEKGSA